MTDPRLQPDLEAMFAKAPAFTDGPDFARAVEVRLRRRRQWRQGSLALAGLAGLAVALQGLDPGALGPRGPLLAGLEPWMAPASTGVMMAWMAAGISVAVLGLLRGVDR